MPPNETETKDPNIQPPENLSTTPTVNQYIKPEGASPNKNKSIKLILVLCALIILVILIVAGIFLYKHHVDKKTVVAQSNKSTTSVEPNISIPDKSDMTYQTLYNIELALSKKYKINQGHQNPPNDDTLSVDWYADDNATGIGPAYQVSGYDFYTIASGYELEVMSHNASTFETTPYVYNSSESDNINNTILNQFSREDFTPSESARYYGTTTNIDDSHLSNVNTFTNDNVICKYNPLISDLSNSTDPANTDDTGLFSIACADLSGYNNLASEINPFADLYYAQNPLVSSSYNSVTGVKSPPELATFSSLEVKNSNTPGYMIATLGVMDYYHDSPSIAFYYEKNNHWQLYYVENDASNPDVLGCTFNDVTNPPNGDVGKPAPGSDATDANLAFIGQPCGAQFGSKPTSTAQ